MKEGAKIAEKPCKTLAIFSISQKQNVTKCSQKTPLKNVYFYAF